MRNFIFLILVFGFQVSSSQDYTQFWFRVSLQHKLNSKFSSTLELHHRTQSSLGTESPFRYPLTNAFRLWINYKISRENSIHFSPYAFFSNYPVVNILGDELRPNANEHRVQLQFENKSSAVRRWTLNSRVGIEYRGFESNLNLLRIRVREGVHYKVSTRLGIQCYDELFINTLQVNRQHIFDQNRIGFILNYTVLEQIRLEYGVTYIQSLPRSDSRATSNLMLQANLVLIL